MPLEAIERSYLSKDIITIVFILVLFVIWFVKTIYYKRFVEFLQMPFSNKYFSAVHREKNLENPFTLMLLSVQVTSFSVLIWYMFHKYKNLEFFNEHIEAFWKILIGVTVFIFLKILLQVIVAAILKIDKLAYQYLYTKINYLNFSSLILMGGLALSIYTSGTVFHVGLSRIFFYLSIVLFLIINLLGFVGLMKNHQKIIFNYFYYIILYLCAFEIAPLLIIGGYITI